MANEPPPEPYPLAAKELIHEWKAECSPPDHEYERVQFFIRRLMRDPESVISVVTHHVPGLPEHTAVPSGTDTQVSWVVVNSPPYEPYARCVMLTKIRPAP